MVSLSSRSLFCCVIVCLLSFVLCETRSAAHLGQDSDDKKVIPGQIKVKIAIYICDRMGEKGMRERGSTLLFKSIIYHVYFPKNWLKLLTTLPLIKLLKRGNSVCSI